VAQQLLSASWYRVAALQPRLRSHARIHRHHYRGERWYVLTDRISRRAHRFTPAAYYVIGLMNGRRTLESIWDAAVARFGDDAPTQDEVIQLLGQLHAADVLQCEVTPDVDELLRRSQRLGRQGRLQKLLSPLALRFPLFDPDRLLERTLAWYRPLFGPFGALLWLAVVGWGAVLAAQHWDALAQDLGHRVLAPGNLVLLALVFPLLKALHEFGHACAVKAWGGEVHEMGVMLLVLMPVPYVDASSASAFPEKRRRVLVGAAGMVVELFVAALALAFWVEMEPGVMRAVLFNVMLIAGVSTVLFNANPLLRFDGYYILADLIEIPNLRQRANQLLAGLAQRWLFGMPVAVPDAGASERAWLMLFAVASFFYRLFITLAIALFVGAHYFIFGVLLALWALVQAFVLPLVGLASYIAFSPRLGRSRPRAVLASALLGALLVAGLGLAPAPSWTTAQGVVALPEQTVVRAGSEGFVQRVVARPGEAVRRGEPLVELADPLLEARLRVLRAQLDELQARYQLERIDRLVRAQITQDQMKGVAADLARARERRDELVMRSPADGVFALAAAQDLPGRFLKPGEPVGHVVAGGGMTVRAIVPQQAVHLVRERTERVELQLAERIGTVYASRIVREVPRAIDRLPSQALSQMGGGEVALDPSAPGGAKTLQSHFEFELALPPGRPVLLGGRVYVRFEHVPEPLAAQLWRWLQQLFLQRLAV
jgi:putative peptide zinc metalloprotease protein